LRVATWRAIAGAPYRVPALVRWPAGSSLIFVTRSQRVTVAGQERTRFRGRERVGWAFTFAAAAYNLARLPKLLEASA